MPASTAKPGSWKRRRVLATAAALIIIMPVRGADPSAPAGLRIDGGYWEDGLSEMCYYAASETIYGKERHFIRVHMINRQWMDAASGVKAEPGSSASVPVFKFVATEEVPAENYNYRYLTTVFLQRRDLSPFKVTVSSQEWCGTTFKHLRWGDQDLEARVFSYFPGEGDGTWRRPAENMPYEALFVIAREVAASEEERSLMLLPPMRSTRAVTPDPAAA
ncbi:MAG: hypothetical protein ACYSUQ_15005, partial [Planctomycetota bacterium]